MKSAYTRIRIVLYTFAIGISSVWMYNGFQIADDYVHVDLPEVESEHVIQVFVKSMFDNMGGGSGHGEPTVTLKQLENTESPRLKFRISNYLDRPIYIPRINSSNPASKDFIPYFIVCQNSDGGQIYTMPTPFEFASVPSRIASKSTADFTIEKPASAQRCVLAVPVGDSESEAQDLVIRNVFDSKNMDIFMADVRYALLEMIDLTTESPQ